MFAVAALSAWAGDVQQPQDPLSITGPASGVYGERLEITVSGGSGTGALSFAVVEGSDACVIVQDEGGADTLEISSGTGTCRIQARKEADEDFDAAESEEHEVAVSKAAQETLAIAEPTSGAYGQTLPLRVTGGSGTGELSFDVGDSTACSLAGGEPPRLEITSGTGSCLLRARQAADDNYEEVESSQFEVAVRKAEQAPLSVTGPNSGAYDERLNITASGGTGSGRADVRGARGLGCLRARRGRERLARDHERERATAGFARSAPVTTTTPRRCRIRTR